MKNNILNILLLGLALSGCAKIDPNGFIVAPSNVEDRYKQSKLYYDNAIEAYNHGKIDISSTKIQPYEFVLYTDYSKPYQFLVGADFHVDSDTGRLVTFMKEATRKEPDPDFPETEQSVYLFSSILGDIAETQPNNYKTALDVIKNYMFEKWVDEDGDTAEYKSMSLFPVVGNHDITHNGWAYYADLFGTSTYTTMVYGIDLSVVGADPDLMVKWIDVNIFLDSANGTMGKGQLSEYLPELFAELKDIKKFDEKLIRNVFVYTHNPFFRPRYDAIAANFPRDELYWLMNYFTENNVDIVFSGHIHAHGDNWFNDVHYVTLNAFSKKNTPVQGELANVTVKGKGNTNISVEFKKFQ